MMLVKIVILTILSIPFSEVYGFSQQFHVGIVEQTVFVDRQKRA